MRTIDPFRSTLLVIDFQTRLMPAIDAGEAAMSNAKRLITAATMLDIPVLFTEQNPKGLGVTVPALAAPPDRTMAKMTFDAVATPEIAARLPADHALVVAGCEAHVCVLQTVLGLLDLGRHVFVASDAVGSRRADSKDAALVRMAHHGAETVTTEMVVFEWLGSAAHPKFREAVALIK